MKDRILVPAVALVLALGLGIGLWLILRDGAPGPVNDASQPPQVEGPQSPPRANNPLHERDFNPAAVLPDPVQVERPQPFRQAETGFRLEVSGRVMDDTGLPVPDARVRFLGEGALGDINGAAFTDHAGRYTLVAWNPRGGRPGPGNRQGRVVATDELQRGGVTPLTALPDQDQAEMPPLVLAAVSEIRGRVQDETGAPAAGVAVFARSLNPHEAVPEGQRSPRVQQVYVTRAATTDGRGEFRLRALRPGRYQLDVERSYHGVSAGPIEVDVAASGAAWVEPVVRAAQGIRGRMIDSDGQPVAGAVVRLQTQDGRPLPPRAGEQPLRLENAADDAFRIQGDRGQRDAGVLRGAAGAMSVTDEQGRFGFFGLQDAPWRLNTRVGAATATLENLKPGTADVTLTVEAQSALSGMVLDAETGRALEHFDLRLVLGGNDRVSPFERVSADRAFAWRPGGHWRLLNPGPGSAIRVSAPGYVPGVLRLTEVAAGERRPNLEIRLLPLCALTLRLRYQNRGVELEPVLLLHERNLAFETSSDAAGTLRLAAVAPTSYDVRVTLRDGTRLAGTLKVPPRATATVDVELAPATEK